MHPDPSNSQRVRQVQLPSGRRIEIVWFADPGARSAGTSQQQVCTREDLHVCPSCSSGMVHPTDWSESGAELWEVALRCPECEWRETAIFGQAQVERLDAVLDDGAELLLADLQLLAYSNMSEAIERFVRAINAGHILPCDF